MNQALKRLKRYYSGFSLRKKIMMSFVLVILALSVSLSSFLYKQSFDFLEGRNKSTFTQMIHQTASSLNSLFSGVEDISRIVGSTDTLRAVLHKDINEEYPLSQQLDDYSSISKLLAVNSFNENVSKVRLYCANSAIYVNENVNFFDIDAIRNEQWFKRTSFLNGGPIWIWQEGNLFCSRSIVDYYREDSVIGILQISLKQDSITDVLNNVLRFSQGDITLVDIDGSAVFPMGEQASALGTYINEYMDTSFISNEIVDYKGNKESVFCSKLSNGWGLIATLPSETFYSSRFKLMLNTIIIALAAIILAMLLTNLIVKNQTNRIQKIVKFMNHVDINSDDSMQEKYNDEITEIQKSFNKMLSTTRKSIQVAEHANKLKKEADYTIWQEQIKPHFLYNCLDSINWISIEHHVPEIAKMSRLLGKFFRLSLSGGSQITSLSDELEHMKTYIEIMQIRFDGNIFVNYDIQPGLEKLQVLKLILQPIVENAILHGISNREAQEGTITIRVNIDGENLYINIMDNGIGMRTEKLGELLTAINNLEGRTGYGLRNVNQRIRLYFGESYGISIESIYDVGTTVSVHLPIIHEGT